MARTQRSGGAIESCAASSGDLVEEPDVGIVENPDVRDVVAEHGDPRRPHPERPSCVAIAVESGRI